MCIKIWNSQNVDMSYGICIWLLFGSSEQSIFNTLRPRQNGWYFPDDIFKYIFLYENVWIPIKNSMKFVPKGPINNIPAVQVIAWRRQGNKPLSEPVVVRLPTHICVTRPQWVNPSVYHKEYFKLLCHFSAKMIQNAHVFYTLPGKFSIWRFNS